MKHLLGLLFCLLPLYAADLVTLSTGAQLTAARAECRWQTCTLHMDGVRIELPASAVAAVERLPEPERAAPPPQAPPPAEPDPRALVTDAALRHGLPPEIVHAVAAVESGYRPHAVSPKGALGVMQLMPRTAAELGADPHDPYQNIDAGVRLLRDLLLKYRNTPNPVRRAIAAYNAGAGAVGRYNGVPPYLETLSYVERVIERYWRLAASHPPRK
ncbi:MAG: lytic transglycosylase domain-containing protein [Bryobacteraceae bacterium]